MSLFFSAILLLLVVAPINVKSFVPPSLPSRLGSGTCKSSLQRNHYLVHRSSSSSEESSENGEENIRSDLDAMRKILESSWNEDTMGTNIPTTPESAASAAAESIFSAWDNKNGDDDEGTVFMVDIGLPSMDPLSGPNVYDDISAVEFCAELAKRINDKRGQSNLLRPDGRCAIVVKDGNLASRSSRLLDVSDEEEAGDVVEFDDFADLGFSDDSSEIKKAYRIGSFLGDNEPPSNGPNMMKNIANFVATNAMPKADAKEEDVIIIACPTMSQTELVGVRLLVSQFSSKTIVIVNNRLNPLPRELMLSETVYSVLPLIARSVTGDSKNPKIVLLRRHPNKWEVHVDDSVSEKGFQLVSAVEADSVGTRGPSMEWIGETVKTYMQGKFGQ